MVKKVLGLLFVLLATNGLAAVKVTQETTKSENAPVIAPKNDVAHHISVNEPTTSSPAVTSSFPRIDAVENDDEKSPVEERANKEKKIPPNSFAITFYKPTYVLPYYFTFSPYTSVYQGNTPEGEQIKNNELKFQISFKVPAWRNILRNGTTLYLAYTQLSYWQAYNHTAFFRETNFEPEIFLANEINLRLIKNMHINFLNVGAVHQSNGMGGFQERSWNRIYLEAISSYENLMVSIKPWVIIKDAPTRRYNPNIGSYLGYGEITVAYKFPCRNVVSLQFHSVFEHGGKHATGELTWSFPVTPFLNLYLDVFSGYGQSLIEYDHRTNSAGIGIALSNWI